MWSDKGLVIPSTEKAKTIENEQVQTQEKVSEMISGLLNLVGSRKAKTATNDVKTPVQNVPHDVAKSNTTEKTMSQFAPSNVAKSTTACCKKRPPIKNKEKNKEKNKGREPESYPLDLPVPDTTSVSGLVNHSHLGGGAVGFDSAFKGYGLAGYASANTVMGVGHV